MADSAKPSLLKQLAGAAIGMTAALALYMGYQTVSPVVTGYLLPPGVTDPADMPQGVNVSARIPEDSEKYVRIGARAQEIANRLDAQPEPVAPVVQEEAYVEPELPEAEPAPAVTPQTADDLQQNARDRRDAREFAATLTASTQVKAAAPAAKAEAKKAEAAPATDAAHGGAPNLPSSGRATNMLAIFMALAATAMLHRKTRVQLLAWARAIR